MVTYADLIQFCLLIVSLVGLCYTIFGGKRQHGRFPQYINDNLKQETALEVTETRKDGEQNGGRIWLT